MEKVAARRKLRHDPNLAVKGELFHHVDNVVAVLAEFEGFGLAYAVLLLEAGVLGDLDGLDSDLRVGQLVLANVDGAAGALADGAADGVLVQLVCEALLGKDGLEDFLAHAAAFKE